MFTFMFWFILVLLAKQSKKVYTLQIASEILSKY